MATALYESLCHLNSQTEVTVSKTQASHMSDLFSPQTAQLGLFSFKDGDSGLERCG